MVGDGLTDLADGRANHVAVSVVRKRRGVVLGGVDVLGGPSERTQAAKVVSDVELKTRIEASDMEACVVLLGSLVGEGVGGVKGADVPDECLRRVVVEVGQVVGDGTAVKRVARDSDPFPEGEQLASGRLDVALTSQSQCFADGFLDGASVTQLSSVLGLTHSGTVRLVDRLAADGLLERVGAQDGRAVCLVLTQRGRTTAARVLQARQKSLASALSALSTEEVEQLATALDSMLTTLTPARVAERSAGTNDRSRPWLCRLCDLTACGRSEGNCPVNNAVTASNGI